MWRAAAWNTWKTPSRLVANMRAPFFLGAVDEGVPSAAADAGIGKAAVDPAERSSVAFIAALTEAASLTSQMRVSTLPGEPAMVAAALLFFSALRPQIETLQPAAASACAMPRPMPPLPPVMTATRPVRSKILMSVSSLVWRALGRASDGGQMFLHQPWTRPSRKSNMGSRSKPFVPRDEITRDHNPRGNRCSSSTSRSSSTVRWPS